MAETIRGFDKSVQLELHEANIKEVWRFDPGTWIYPAGNYRGGGTIEEPLTATRTNEKLHGLKHIYTARESCSFFYRGKYYTLPKDTRFTAMTKKAHKVKLG